MDIDEVNAVYYIYDRHVKKKKKNKYWKHPFLQAKDETRHYDIFFENLQKYEDKFLYFCYKLFSIKLHSTKKNCQLCR